MPNMTKRERVGAALRGEPADRAPVSAWWHDFAREWTPDGLAEATLEAYRRYDWDWIKLNPRATYYLEGWGAEFERPDPSGPPKLVKPPVRFPDTLMRMRFLDPRKGPFGEQVEAIRILKRELGDETFLIQTVFSPLAIIGRLMGDIEQTKAYMAEHPGPMHTGLAVVTETLSVYAKLCLDAGADGIFFATVDFGTYDNLTEEQHRTFARPYDLQVLSQVQDAAFNVVHVCRDRAMLDPMLDYPVHAFHWAATLADNPSLVGVLARTDRAVMGGLSERGALRDGTPGEAAAEAGRALAETGGRRLLLAPGCAVDPPPATPEANLRAVAEFVRTAQAASGGLT